MIKFTLGCAGLLLSSLPLSQAASLAGRQGSPELCSPEFDGRPVSFANSAVNWGLESGLEAGKPIQAASGSFNKALLVVKAKEGTHWPTEYTFASFNESSLNVFGVPYGGLIWAKPDATNPNERFIIECKSGCSPAKDIKSDSSFVADGCVVRSASNGQCVQVGKGPWAGSQGDAVHLQKCDASDSQRFNILLTTSAGKGSSPVPPPPPPPPAPEFCSPDFDLFPASIHNSGVKLSLIGGVSNGAAVKAQGGSFDKALFNFKKVNSGNGRAQYSLGLFNDTSLGLNSAANGDIVFKTANAGDPNENFLIECTSGCTPASKIREDSGFIADGCRIRSATTGQCIQIGSGPRAGGDGDSVRLLACDGTDSQRYNILKTVSIPTPVVRNPNRFRIIVGPDGRLVYETASIKAAPGDLVTFEFRQKNHTVTESTFDAPCTPVAGPLGGFKSGFQPVAADVRFGFPEFTITVNDTAPIWGYCGQTGHCNAGMVFGINAPESGIKTFAAFQALAKSSTSTLPPNGNNNGTTGTCPSGTGQQKVLGALTEGDEDVSAQQKVLLRNSYILMGLLAGILLALIFVLVLLARGGRVGLKGKSSGGAYAKVSLPKGGHDDDSHGLTHPEDTRYSDRG